MLFSANLTHDLFVFFLISLSLAVLFLFYFIRHSSSLGIAAVLWHGTLITFNLFFATPLSFGLLLYVFLSLRSNELNWWERFKRLLCFDHPSERVPRPSQFLLFTLRVRGSSVAHLIIVFLFFREISISYFFSTAACRLVWLWLDGKHGEKMKNNNFCPCRVSLILGVVVSPCLDDGCQFSLSFHPRRL